MLWLFFGLRRYEQALIMPSKGGDLCSGAAAEQCELGIILKGSKEPQRCIAGFESAETASIRRGFSKRFFFCCQFRQEPELKPTPLRP